MQDDDALMETIDEEDNEMATVEQSAYFGSPDQKNWMYNSKKLLCPPRHNDGQATRLET